MATAQMTRPAWPAISENARLRLSLIFLMYIAQGLPLGLFYIAIPAWLATNGASALQVGAFLSAVSLPWTLKFANGFIMERFTWLPMGRRRAWLIGSQLLIVAGLLAIAVLSPGPRDIAMLSALAFLINIATTFQDVAVDGMAVDLLPDEERPRANGLMFGGQALGMAGAGAAAGFGIGVIGLSGVTALMALLVTALVLVVACSRERPGERLLPWTAGEASPETLAVQLQAWLPIFAETWRGMIRVPSLFLVVPLMMAGVMSGFYSGITPLIAANSGGWSTAETSRHMAGGSLLAGVLAVLVFGALVARVGPRRMAMLTQAMVAALGLAMLITQPLWGTGTPILAFIYIADPLNFLWVICLAPIAMRHCRLAVAATQFGLYMAISNLGRTISSALLGPLDRLGGDAAIMIAFAASGLIGLVVLLFARCLDAPVPDEELRPR